MSKDKKYSSFLTEQKMFDNWRDYLKEENEMSKPRKNKKFIDPRYFMDEKIELNEGIRKGLREVYSPQVADELAEFLTEGPLDTAFETGAEAMTGPTSVQASDISPGQALPAALGGKGLEGQLQEVGELLIWLVDWIPNLLQAVGGIKEAEVGFFIKGLRLASRVFGAPVKALGHTLVKMSTWVGGLDTDQRQYLEDTVSGRPHKAEEPQATEPRKLAAVAERRRIKRK